jgi:hypothetical protein
MVASFTSFTQNRFLVVVLLFTLIRRRFVVVFAHVLRRRIAELVIKVCPLGWSARRAERM